MGTFTYSEQRRMDAEPDRSGHASHAEKVRFADAMMAESEPKACGCTRDDCGPVYCDEHRPAPPPDPEGACVLCHFVGRVDDLVTGKDGVRWHRHCASDNS